MFEKRAKHLFVGASKLRFVVRAWVLCSHTGLGTETGYWILGSASIGNACF